MDVGILPNFKSNVNSICDKLLNENKLITTKNVIDALSASLEQPIDPNAQEYVTKIINVWRLSRLQQSIEVIPKIVKPTVKKLINADPRIDYHKICRKLSRYSRQLIKAKREIKFLRAKIKALNSFYNRQRQEFIMRIEGMLYK